MEKKKTNLKMFELSNEMNRNIIGEYEFVSDNPDFRYCPMCGDTNLTVTTIGAGTYYYVCNTCGCHGTTKTKK